MNSSFIARPVFSLLLIILISTGCFSQQRGGVQQAERETIIKSPDFENDILFHVNEYRKSKGLAALEMNAAISEQAEKHSRNMAAKKVPFSHDGFEDRVKVISGKIGGVRTSAENVAYGHLTAEQVVAGWVKSPGHRKNIEGSKYTITGIGIGQASDGTVFFTQIFVSK